jgi:predicted dehydrogenase
MSDTANVPLGSAPQASITRRKFLAGSGAAALGFTILEPGLVSGSEANSKISLGLIGCGGRGKWITDLFQKHGGYNIVGVFDYFDDRAGEAGEKFQVPASSRYTGLNGFRKLLEQKGLDAVAIESPPYFHPLQAAAAVEAGKHVYLAKPIAVDVPGCHTVAESGRKATERKLCFLADFQTRAHPSYQTAVKKVHDGEIGKIICGEATYFCSLMFQTMDQQFRKTSKNPEARLRAWAIDRVLSGDVITEQNIHALDVAAWILNAEPVKAQGAGGRAREFEGDCWDHFAVVFHYPNGVLLNFTSKQVGAGWDDICCRVYGTAGTIDTHYFGEVNVICDEPFKGGRMQNLYTDGAVNNIATFHKSILGGDHSNPTVAPSVRSNLTTILGRTAAYTKREVTWEQMLKANEKFEFDLRGLKG